MTEQTIDETRTPPAAPRAARDHVANVTTRTDPPITDRGRETLAAEFDAIIRGVKP